MAALPRCLCLVLALLTVGWRPSAFVKTRSIDSCVCRDSALQLRLRSRPDHPSCDYSVLGGLFPLRSKANPAQLSNNAIARRSRLRFPKMDEHFAPVRYDNQAENFQNRTSLIDFLNGLSTYEIFLSFYSEQEESYVQRLVRMTITVHRWSTVLRSRDKSEAVSSADQSNPEGYSERFYQNRFRELELEETCQGTWLLPADDTTCKLQFAALGDGAGRRPGERSCAEFFEDDPQSAAVGRPCGCAGQNRRFPGGRGFLSRPDGLGI
jgi:hypothetical protein